MYMCCIRFYLSSYYIFLSTLSCHSHLMEEIHNVHVGRMLLKVLLENVIYGPFD